MIRPWTDHDADIASQSSRITALKEEVHVKHFRQMDPLTQFFED